MPVGVISVCAFGYVLFVNNSVYHETCDVILPIENTFLGGQENGIRAGLDIVRTIH